MNRSALLLATGAGLLLAAGAANAGTCSAEIQALQKTIANIGTVASEVPQPAAKTGTIATAGSEPVPAPNGTDATGGTVASATPGGSGGASGIAPGKVEQPKASGGTLAQSGGAGGAPVETAPQDSVMPEAGPPDSGATGVTPDPDAASQSLARAQVLDQAGDEAGCMNEVNQAKSQLGQQ
jgi:hypothetical protein